MTAVLHSRSTSARTSVEAHLTAALALVKPTEVCRLPLSKSAGLVSAEDLRAPGFLPAFDNSAMDGYAVHGEDIDRAPRTLPLVAEIAAGRELPPPLIPGTSAPIMTGAPLPVGAATVVPLEHAVQADGGVRLLAELSPGGHVRRRGEEHRPGDVLLERGRPLRPVDLAVLAAAGIAVVPVHRAPRVAILGTGAELVAPGRRRAGGAIHDANSTLLDTLVRAQGAEVTTLTPTGDDPEQVRAVVERASTTHDLVLTAGGVSTGAHDVVREALTGRGVDFGKVDLSPGSPQGLGSVAGTPVLALPGNPSAALVSCLMFVRPVLRALAGFVDVTSGWTSSVTATPLGRHPMRTRVLPVVLDGFPGGAVAQPCGTSHHLGSFAAADAVMRIEPGRGDVATGSTLPALRL